MSIIDRKSQAWEHTNARTRSESVISQISTCHSTIPPDVTTVQVENGWQKFQDDDISVPLDDEIELGPKFSRGLAIKLKLPLLDLRPGHVVKLTLVATQHVIQVVRYRKIEINTI